MKMLENYAVPAKRMLRSTSRKLLSSARTKPQIMQFETFDELERMRNSLYRFKKNHYSEFKDIRIRMISDDLVIILDKLEEVSRC